MFGRFLEISLPTAAIADSADFYQRLGFQSLATRDVYAHRYGVYGDGRVQLGLHEGAPAGAVLSFVLPQLAATLERLRAGGFAPRRERLGFEDFHQIEFADPAGTAVRLLEARTYSPAAAAGETRLGRFAHYSLPVRDAAAAAAWWERAGFVALPELTEPYAHVPLTSDTFDLAFHSPRLLDAPCLVYTAADMDARIAALRGSGAALEDAPRGLERAGNALLVAPEGTMFLLLSAEE